MIQIDKSRFQNILDEEILSIDFLTQGQIGPIYRLKTPGSQYLLKISSPSERLRTEADMLKDIKKYDIAVPSVRSVSSTYLLMDYIEESFVPLKEKERMAAEILIRLHSVSNESRMYGYWYDTTIGPFRQNNEQTQYNWALFFGQMRLVPMAKTCFEKELISQDQFSRIESLSRDLYRRIDMSAITPSLLHGDLWSGNILFNIKGATLIDPALYFGDREVDLAFIRMFDTFGDDFFAHYTQTFPLSEDFYEVKEPLYQLYFYLLHVALYGRAYLSGVDCSLRRLKV